MLRGRMYRGSGSGEADLLMRRMVGDLELNLGVAIVSDQEIESPSTQYIYDNEN